MCLWKRLSQIWIKKEDKVAKAKSLFYLCMNPRSHRQNPKRVEQTGQAPSYKLYCCSSFPSWQNNCNKPTASFCQLGEWTSSGLWAKWALASSRKKRCGHRESMNDWNIGLKGNLSGHWTPSSALELYTSRPFSTKILLACSAICQGGFCSFCV